jgi:cellulose synthase/poly-beta-1,6-N-acetylglucosamine synthase-like glycosyltransferase
MAHPAGEFHISVVIIGRDEGNRLVRCIESVQRMDWPKNRFEIIYVDSASQDGSQMRAKNLGIRVIELETKWPTAALGRNAGWHAAANPYILFLDGDTILHPNFVKNACRPFADSNVAVVCGSRREIAPQKSIYNRVVDLDWVAPMGPSEYCGGDAMIRRSILEEVGGYDDKLIAGEEPEMCARIRAKGYTVLRINHPMTEHDINMTHFSEYWRRAVRTGYAYEEITSRFRGTNEKLWIEESRRSQNHAVFFLTLFLAATLTSIRYMTLLPLLGATVATLLLSVRTAIKSKWRSPDLTTRLLYGVHSHFQHIPIFVGQIRYHIEKLSKHRPARLIEYKDAAQRRNRA